jgi:hypothetical protein
MRRVSALITAMIAATALAASSSVAAPRSDSLAATQVGPKLAGSLSTRSAATPAARSVSRARLIAATAAVPQRAKAALRLALTRQQKPFRSAKAAGTTTRTTSRVSGKNSRGLLADDHWNFNGCSDWYLTSAYGGWWSWVQHYEYTCSWWYEYDSTGLDLADIYAYYVPNFYGYWYHNPGDCTWYWWDVSDARWFSIYGC